MKKAWLIAALIAALFAQGCWIDELWSDKDDDPPPKEDPTKIYRKLQ